MSRITDLEQLVSNLRRDLAIAHQKLIKANDEHDCLLARVKELELSLSTTKMDRDIIEKELLDCCKVIGHNSASGVRLSHAIKQQLHQREIADFNIKKLKSDNAQLRKEVELRDTLLAQRAYGINKTPREDQGR